MAGNSGPVKERALVLRTIRHGESSRVATLFGAVNGKFAVIAKGARSGKSGSLGSSLDPPGLGEMVVHFKPSRSVQILGQAIVLESFDKIKGDIELTAYAALISELILRGFVDGEANEHAFDSALKAYRSLDAAVMDPILSVWEFLLALSMALGFGIEVNACPVCSKNPAQTGLNNQFWLDEGAICCAGCTAQFGKTVRLSGESVALLRMVTRGGNAMQRVKISPGCRTELTAALIEYLRLHHSGYETLQSLSLLHRLTIQV